MTENVKLFTDGGARGNPGPAAVAALALGLDGQEIFRVNRAIGHSTNNQAEYLALIEGLNAAKKAGVKSIECFSDSQLMVNQLNGAYKVKDLKLKPLFAEVRAILMAMGGKISFTHISREQNRLADKLVNQALN